MLSRTARSTVALCTIDETPNRVDDCVRRREVDRRFGLRQLDQFMVSSDQRWPDFPDVPTMEEEGFKDFVFATDTVLLAPAKTPGEIVK